MNPIVLHHTCFIVDLPIHQMLSVAGPGAGEDRAMQSQGGIFPKFAMLTEGRAVLLLVYVEVPNSVG